MGEHWFFFFYSKLSLSSRTSSSSCLLADKEETRNNEPHVSITRRNRLSISENQKNCVTLGPKPSSWTKIKHRPCDRNRKKAQKQPVKATCLSSSSLYCNDLSTCHYLPAPTDKWTAPEPPGICFFFFLYAKLRSGWVLSTKNFSSCFLCSPHHSASFPASERGLWTRTQD